MAHLKNVRTGYKFLEEGGHLQTYFVRQNLISSVQSEPWLVELIFDVNIDISMQSSAKHTADTVPYNNH